MFHSRISAAVVTLVAGVLSGTAYAAGPSDFLVNDLNLYIFKRNIFELSTIPAFTGSPTASRHWQQPGNATAVNYLKAKLELFGYTNVTLDPYVFSGQTRHNIYATKMGTVNPTQMYIISGHMDSINFDDFTNAPGADDDGSGTSLVLEAARVFAKARTDKSVRFILWNNEETGLDGSEAYVASHAALQGTLSEPTWLGIIQHDMILLDRFPVPDADVEYQALHDFGGQAITLANAVGAAMATYGSMPAQVSNNMNFTDSVPFQDLTAAVSVRENRRVAEIGTGSNPNWHQASDHFHTYTQADYAFGFNIVKMSVGALGELVNAERDCNMNNIGDASEIAGGAPDVNGDGILDVCQDCNTNGTLDPIEIAGATVPDCNGNGRPDSCDLASGLSYNCNAGTVPDECELGTDDCNTNDIPDSCDIAIGRSDDVDSNFVPDECQCVAPETPIAEAYFLPTPGTYATKNRYLSFQAPPLPPIGASTMALKVTFALLPGPDPACPKIPDFSSFQNVEMWVGAQVFQGSTPTGLYQLQNTPLLRDWSTVPGGIIQVSDCNIVPCARYHVQAITDICSTASAANFSAALVLQTTPTWGDAAGTFNGGSNAYRPADGNVDFGDIGAAVDRFKNLPIAPPRPWCDLHSNRPAQGVTINIDFNDISAVVDAFKGLTYPFPGPSAPNPCAGAPEQSQVVPVCEH